MKEVLEARSQVLPMDKLKILAWNVYKEEKWARVLFGREMIERFWSPVSQILVGQEEAIYRQETSVKFRGKKDRVPFRCY